MYTIVLDCGASFMKGAVFSEKGEILTRLQKQAPVLRQDEEIERPIQITEIFLNAKEMLASLVEAGGKKSYKLCISNEMHGFLLADAEGNPVTDYISWQREYGSISVDGVSAIEELMAEENAEDILYTGMKLRSSHPSCNLLYLWKRGFFREKKETLYFYTLGDYILRRLSEKTPLCHPSNAAATGLYDLRTENWNQKLTAIYREKDIVRFPTIGFGRTDFVLEGMTFQACPAIGDQQAALLGAGLSSGREVSFNLGTGAQVARVVKKFVPGTGYQTRPYFYGCYLRTIPHLPSGRALNVYFRFVKNILEQFGMEEVDDQIWDKILEAAKEGEDTGIKCDLSFFENPLTPFCKGSLENIGEYELTAGNLFHAVFKQMADNFAEAAESLYDRGEKAERLIFSGGIARKITPVREKILKRYGKDIEYVVTQDETLNGLYKYGNMVAAYK